MLRERKNHTRKAEGFSLIELLAVMAIIAVLMTAMMPLLSNFTGTAGRRGAVNTLMNAFEQARVAALESNSKVYVIMRRNATLGQSDSFLIVREKSESLGESGDPYVLLGRWQKLPVGILFFKAPKTLTDNGKNELPAALMAALPGSVPQDELFGIAFNKNGQIASPSLGDVKLQLYLAEATRNNDAEASRAPSAAVTEMLSFRRYTGRAQLDYTAPPAS